ncbi:hypothetical protein RSSM_03706 [Rhodopirellula sallentina SM41]|uniref:Uncharacterized protein n=1 Tax=Rhodopirellula sallentina SM41 TaxID=1263870 RepID=M5U038_9BACT|nr:hypothetical protein RSSM_03706 [Rhodopirellula sallentina SM41]
MSVEDPSWRIRDHLRGRNQASLSVSAMVASLDRRLIVKAPSA